MSLKRQKSIIMLMVVFGWSFLKDLEHLFRSSSTDRALFQHVGLEYVFVLLLGSIALLDFFSLWFLIKPRKIGKVICFSALAVSAFESIVGTLIARANLDFIRNAYVTSRQDRGLAVSEEALNSIVNPNMLLILLGGSLLLTAVWAYFIYRNKEYFNRAGSVAG